MRLVLLEPRPNNKWPKLSSKINRMAKKKTAYEMFCTGSLKSMIKSRLKKLPADRAADSISCDL